ncbi:uncharacterized protein LOC126769658 [Nymphalis io]|uniref:uncharacterized protein LOC126769658 n=1 Tax=Inachis io TaxID=171585 RepID=UPI00216A14CB|nr:uncharacterized protein LOC126769658 [Nymphalis io]
MYFVNRHQVELIMELLDAILFKSDLKTADIRAENIQEVLLAVKHSVNSEHTSEYYDKILEKLWLHLLTELQEFEDQLLCSTCFYTVLCKTNRNEVYLNKVLEIINHELNLKENDLNGSKTSLAVSLCYGVFQSSYLLRQPINFNVTMERTLEAIFQFLTLKAYEYTQYTFIVFKIMTSFKKIVGTELQNILFNTNNQIKLLNLINHNWENPITGIRNLNRIVFQTLLLVLNQNIYETILNEINSFYWNKAKYMMLAEIIEQYKGKIESFISDNQWIDGLVYSLSKPGLVSAGADMYNAVLKKTNSDETWTALFRVRVIDILSGTRFKTIENFSNYWCLNTLKKFPSLMQLLVNELNNINNSEYTLYSTMCIIKQGTKLGISGKKISNCDYELKKEDQLVTLALEHCHTSVRIVAFEIISISQRNCLPSNVEYKQILKYLSDNVNSDCTVLRISMINHLSIFLNKLHILYLNTVITNYNQDIQHLITFCQSLQNFVIESIGSNGNYQRKLTSVKIAQTVLKSFHQLTPKKRNKDTRVTNKSLVGFLKECGHWKLHDHGFIMKLLDLLKDPANDVHEGVLQLLSEFYITELSEPFIMNFLIQEGLKCIASKFFYEISCGQIMFKLVINILLKNNSIESRFNNLEDIFHFSFNEISLEYSSKRDIVKSIEDGKQLHSFLNILCIIFEVSIKNSFELTISKDAIFSLLDIIDYISNQFVWEEDLSTCSDFSKMSDMVQTLIKKSGLETDDDNDHTRISDLHQIVLNCLWLNVKASCELASLLIQYYKLDQSICEKCLNIITHALETSRHKGAIEAAGTALGFGIQCLSSLADEQVVSKLPFFLLKNKLEDLLFETTKMSSVTRRGAGLSIMVHRIVSSDLKKGKPLFHYFMRTLLDMCTSIDNTSYSEDTFEIDNERDLPKAIYIHFLTRIVTDSSLASDTMYYSAELAALAFNNLINNHWQIRNAALQLYGALIPKLIGQKKASGTDEKTIATVAFDEFRSHFPKLWEYIIKQIKQNDYKDIIQAHSNLVPILNVLASLAKRYNFSYDLKEQDSSDLSLLPNILSLLGSPIYTVRRLTSLCITNIYSFDKLFNILENNEKLTENYLHGILMLISNCYKYYSKIELLKLDRLSIKYQGILKQSSQSYLCRWSLDKFCKESENITIESIKNILCEVDTKRYEPGVSLWANSKIQKYIENMPWSIVPDTLRLLLKTQEFELYCATFIKRIEGDMKPFEDFLLESAKVLLSSEMRFKSSSLWKLLYNISLTINMNVEIYNISGIHEHIKLTSYKLRYLIPVTTRLLVKQRNHEGLLLLSKSIYILCNPENNDVDMRHIATLANNEFGNELGSYSDDVKINAIKSAIILLQDEDEDVRSLCVHFYMNFKKEPKHPFICLNNILKKEFLYEVLNEPKNIQVICNDLLSFVDSTGASKHNEYNPFSNDSKNIYLEKDLFKLTLQKLSKL